MAFVLQSVVLVVLFVSMWFRMKGNHLVHGITMIVAVVPVLIGSFVVLTTQYTDSSYMQPYMSSASTFIAFSLHTILGVATLIFGVWLVALWRPRSTDFVARSKRIWQLTVIVWVSSYVVGVLLYLLL
jgi:uncharacterized membrane protein YozB (DUF420 family)